MPVNVRKEKNATVETTQSCIGLSVGEPSAKYKTVTEAEKENQVLWYKGLSIRERSSESGWKDNTTTYCGINSNSSSVTGRHYYYTNPV